MCYCSHYTRDGRARRFLSEAKRYGPLSQMTHWGCMEHWASGLSSLVASCSYSSHQMPIGSLQTGLCAQAHHPFLRFPAAAIQRHIASSGMEAEHSHQGWLPPKAVYSMNLPNGLCKLSKLVAITTNAVV